MEALRDLLRRQVEARARRLRAEADGHPGSPDDHETVLRTHAAQSIRRAALAGADEIAALLEGLTDGQGTARRLVTGWAPVDDELGGGLRMGALHEWFGQWSTSATADRRAPWTAPMLVLTHLVRQALRSRDACGDGSNGAVALWIGRACWPSASWLGRETTVWRRCVLVDDVRPAERLWAIDLALRTSGVAAVVADGSDLDLAATRRLQLAAERGGAMALLARSPAERSTLSAATTRWLVMPSRGVHLRSIGVRIELLRRKGMRPTRTTGADTAAWSLEQDDATGDLVVAAGLAGGSAAPQNAGDAHG